MQFTNKTAIVTGGSSGIGAILATRLAAAGAQVAIVASADRGKAASVVTEIERGGGVARPYVLDVRDAEAVTSMFMSVERDFGGIDLLANVAGVFIPTPVGMTAAGEFERVIDINLSGTWNCLQAAVPAMKRRGGGKIVNFASVAGVIGIKSFAAYCASKAAIIMLTRVAAAELAASGINVNAIAPGNTATPMNAALRNDPANAAVLEKLRKIAPSGVPFSDPAAIAEVALFLLSEQAGPVHGATWVVDEGVSAAPL